jgi:uroporphyrinogen decarboxylase
MPPLTKTQSTGIERVQGALNRKPADRLCTAPMMNSCNSRVHGIPFEEWASPVYWKDCAKSYNWAQDLFDLDCVVTKIDHCVEARDLGQKVIYPNFDCTHPDYNDYFIKNPSGYKELAEKVKDWDVMDPGTRNKEKRFGTTIQMNQMLVEMVQKECAVYAYMNGPLVILSMMRGPDELLGDCEKNAADVGAATAALADLLVRFGKALAEVSDGVFIDTSLASKTFLGKDAWEKLEGQHLGKIAKAVKDAGKVFGVVNDGLDPYFDKMIKSMSPDVIANAYLPDDCASMEEMRKKWVEKRDPDSAGLTYTCAMGMVSGLLLYGGTMEEIHEEVKREFASLDAKGGLICSSGGEYPPDADLNTATYMVDASKMYCTY